MSDCLQNEDSIVSDLSSSNTDSLTGKLDSGDNVNSDISIGDAMVSSISDGDSTDSNLGDDGSLYSELGIGGGGGAKYTGQETDSIEIIVDNNVYTISANLKPIKFNSISDFPLVGSEKLIYVDFSNKTLYGWDAGKGVYYKLVADVKIPTKLSEFTNDAGFITNTVNNLVEYYKKTETYTQEEIDSKISAIPKFAIKVVAELPTTEISETTVYLVASGSDDSNLYVEYIYVDGVWEKLGEQTLDLSSKMDKENPTGTGSFSLNRQPTSSIGQYSTAEGINGTASGRASHAEGNQTFATGAFSHTEGNLSVSTGRAGHAEGDQTRANGDYSHTEGKRTFAKSRSQHIFGEYNIVDETGSYDSRGAYVEIVGNGDADENLSNARTLDWDGNEWLAGNLQAKGLTDGIITKTMAEILAGGGTKIIWEVWE